MEIKEIEISLETSISSIMPNSVLSLLYSIENKGNVDVNLSPVLDLPIGWEQNTILEEIPLSWTESRNLMISVSAGENARSGDIRFVVYADGENWFETVNVDVIQLADPYLTFASLEIEGETWDHPFGPGQHPSGIS